MQAQGHEEPVGRAKITKGYNLPEKFVLHTVGLAVSGTVTQEDEKSWNPVTVPAWNWQKPMESGALHSAVFQWGYSVFPTDGRRRLPSRRLGNI